MASDERWPPLPLAEWSDSYTTLQRWLQIVGKTRLALMPMQNHWWQVALYVTARGLGTSAMPCGDRTIDIEFDFIDHELVIRTSDRRQRVLKLEPRSVADFYATYIAALHALGVAPKIYPVPSEMPDVTPFTSDREHAAYDPDAAQRCWRILAQTTRVFLNFRQSFLGKCSPVHVWWGAFDLACTRFSGRVAPPHPGGIPHLPDRVTREAYSHECISAGWWPGSAGILAEPAFYAYAYPEPPGCPDAPLRPDAARYDPQLHEWILPYEAVRTSADPDAMLLDFLHSTYDAAAELAHWDRPALERTATH